MPLLPHRALKRPEIPSEEVIVHDDTPEERRAHQNRLYLFQGTMHIGGRPHLVLFVRQKRGGGKDICWVYHRMDPEDASRAYKAYDKPVRIDEPAEIGGKITASIPIKEKSKDVRWV